MPKNKIISGLLILLVLSTSIFTSCGGNNMSPEKALNSFSKLVAEGSFNDLKLTIYYKSPFTLTLFPLSVDNLVYGGTAINDPPGKKSDTNGVYDQKTIVDGIRLEEYIDLLTQISSDVLTPVTQKSSINARIYYMFENKGKKIFDVAMWGGNSEGNSIFVNGVECKENEVFYDIIMPFLPENEAKELQTYLNGLK